MNNFPNSIWLKINFVYEVNISKYKNIHDMPNKCRNLDAAGRDRTYFPGAIT